jgi:hypothetical protein
VSTIDEIVDLATRLHEMPPEDAVRCLVQRTEGTPQIYRRAARQMIELHGPRYTAAWRMGACLLGAARAVAAGQRTASRSPQGA